MKKLRIVLLCLVVGLPSLARAQEKKAGDKMDEMKIYYLVFLKKGENRTQDAETVKKLQEQHLAHLDKMAADGKLDICGPMAEDIDIRGICIYNVATKEEAEKLANDDPMVKAGRLKVEVHPFYSAKGVSLK